MMPQEAALAIPTPMREKKKEVEVGDKAADCIVRWWDLRHSGTALSAARFDQTNVAKPGRTTNVLRGSSNGAR
jgi:hypothetical protein